MLTSWLPTGRTPVGLHGARGRPILDDYNHHHRHSGIALHAGRRAPRQIRRGHGPSPARPRRRLPGHAGRFRTTTDPRSCRWQRAGEHPVSPRHGHVPACARAVTPVAYRLGMAAHSPTACPPAATPAVARRMSRHPRRDTGPELRLRTLLHAMGLRYRVHRRPEPAVRRTADVVFTRARVALFLDGCWWHGCTRHWRPPRHNANWWTAKIQANRERDAETDRLLEQAGWTVVRVWEHEDLEQAARRVFAIVGRARTSL